MTGKTGIGSREIKNINANAKEGITSPVATIEAT